MSSDEYDPYDCMIANKRPRTQSLEEEHTYTPKVESKHERPCPGKNLKEIVVEEGNDDLNATNATNFKAEAVSNFDSEEFRSQRGNPLWPKILSKFLKELKLDQTYRVLETELLILPDSLYYTADSLLLSKLDELKLLSPTSAPSFITKETQAPVEFDDSLLDVNDNAAIQSDAKLAGSVELDVSENEMESMVQSFISQMKEKSYQNNLRDYIDDKCEGSCARTNIAKVDQDHLKKVQVIHNANGPLLPTIIRGSSLQAKELTALSKTIGDPFEVEDSVLTYPTIIERLENIENHLNLILDTDFELTPIQRIRAVEHKLMQIERSYPSLAAKVFNQPKSDHPPPPAFIQNEGDNVYLSSYPRDR